MTDTQRDQASKDIQDVQRWLSQLQEQIAKQTPQAIAKLERADDIVGRLPDPPVDPPSPPDDPPTPPDPKPDPPPPVDSWSFPSPVINRPENLDYIIAGSELRNPDDTRIGTFQNPIKAAMLAAKPGSIVRLGVKGETRGLIYADGSKHAADTAYQVHSNGEYATPTIHMVGLTPDAKIHGVSLGSQIGRLHALRLFDLTIGDQSEAAAMCLGTKGGARLAELVIDNCMFAPSGTGYGGLGGKWGMHPDDGADLFVWRKCKRAQVNGIPVKFQEHVGYIKNMGAVFIESNDLSGGNRTGFQYRSDESEDQGIRPHGPVVVRNNYADGYGMEHDAHSGGSCMTLWSNPDYQTLVEGNSITNARYGCLAVAHAETSYHDDDGYSHNQVMVRNNTFSQHPGRGQKRGNDHRVPARVASTRHLTWHSNDVSSTNGPPLELIIDHEFAYNHGAPLTLGVSLDKVPAYRVGTYDRSNNVVRRYTQAQLTTMVGD